jgi:Mg-chelatase subunit ChlD
LKIEVREIAQESAAKLKGIHAGIMRDTTYGIRFQPLREIRVFPSKASLILWQKQSSSLPKMELWICRGEHMSAKRFFLSSTLLVAGTMLVYSGLTANAVPSVQENEAQSSKASKPRIDLAFCIDTTGSMGNEIAAVKEKTKEIVAKLSGSKPAPEIRVGLVAYRDRGDEYVTKVFPFSNNIDQVVKDISSLQANGGGDGPEAVNEALHASVHGLNWSTDKKTVKVLFLIGDAEPHYYPNDYSWETESKEAIAHGIQINTIACDGLDSFGSGREIFQNIAKLADGKCESLTYRQEIVDAGGHKTTLLSSAGKTYRVSAPSATAWREGADKLMAKGAAVALPSVVAGASLAPSAMSAGDSFDTSLRTATRGIALPHAAGARAKASYGALAGAGGGAGASEGYAAAPSVSRADSNLADIVLSATRDAAKKKANIEFKD